MEIKHIKNAEKGIFEALDGEAMMGKLSYVWSGHDKIVVEHTDVDPAYGGKGVGKNLVLAAVAFARAANIKIVPSCSYAKAVIQKDESLHDVLT